MRGRIYRALPNLPALLQKEFAKNTPCAVFRHVKKIPLAFSAPLWYNDNHILKQRRGVEQSGSSSGS
jgi:hypothetical protein